MELLTDSTVCAASELMVLFVCCKLTAGTRGEGATTHPHTLTPANVALTLQTVPGSATVGLLHLLLRIQPFTAVLKGGED